MLSLDAMGLGVQIIRPGCIGENDKRMLLDDVGMRGESFLIQECCGAGVTVI